jgi:hypothetical protein
VSSFKDSNSTNPPTEWLSPPVLGIPDWPGDNQLDDAYTTSRLSSPIISTPAEMETRAYFDDYLQAALQQHSLTCEPTEIIKTSCSPYPQTGPYSDCTPNWARATSQASDVSNLPLFVDIDLLAQGNDEDHDATLNEGSIDNFNTAIAFTGENFPQMAFKGSWPSKETKRHSASFKSGRTSSRTSEKEQASPRKASSSSSSKRHRLRSTQKGDRINYSEKGDAPSKRGTKGSKTSHNMVEKQYRSRLNSQFSNLLGFLPPETVDAEVDGYGRSDSGSAEKKVSKAEVLMLAKRHIEKLEQENMSLEGNNKELLENMMHLRGTWARMGGCVPP